MIEKAYNIANNAHKGQLRKSGEPYIIHPLCVALILADLELDKETIVGGLLHDVVEDTSVTFTDLEKEFPKEVIEALKLLTHGDGVNYMEYIENIKSNEIATKVKIGDLKHNMDTSRLDIITDEDLIREEKYKRSLEILES